MTNLMFRVVCAASVSLALLGCERNGIAVKTTDAAAKTTATSGGTSGRDAGAGDAGGGATGDGGTTGSGGKTGVGGTGSTGIARGTGGVAGTHGSSVAGSETTASQFVVSADGLTVADTYTGLIWQRDGSGPRPSCAAADGLTCTSTGAQAYCAALNISGTSGWRLPTLREMRTIVDHTIDTRPAIDTIAFPDTPIAYFWTSTPVINTPQYQSSVTFKDGTEGLDLLGSYNRVRCVHDGAKATSTGGIGGSGVGGTGGGPSGIGGASGAGGGQTGRFVISDDTLIVTDTRTGIEWQRNGSWAKSQCTLRELCTWDEAKTFCAGLVLDGSGWSLPTRAQLDTLMDDTQYPPLYIDVTIFPKTPAAPMWTSTLATGSSVNVWVVDFGEGIDYPYSSAREAGEVRCARTPGGVPGSGGVTGP